MLESGEAGRLARTLAPPVVESGGDGLRGLRLVAPTDARGAVAGILLVGVGVAAQAELAAGVLPGLAVTIPMEAKLGQLLPNLGGGLLGEANPNPFADDFREAVNIGEGGQQGVQHFGCRQRAVLLPRFRINREAVVLLSHWRGCGRFFRCGLGRRLGLMMGSVVEL